MTSHLGVGWPTCAVCEYAVQQRFDLWLCQHGKGRQLGAALPYEPQRLLRLCNGREEACSATVAAGIDPTVCPRRRLHARAIILHERVGERSEKSACSAGMQTVGTLFIYFPIPFKVGRDMTSEAHPPHQYSHISSHFAVRARQMGGYAHIAFKPFPMCGEVQPDLAKRAGKMCFCSRKSSKVNKITVLRKSQYIG